MKHSFCVQEAGWYRDVLACGFRCQLRYSPRSHVRILTGYIAAAGAFINLVSAPGLGTWPASNCDLRTKVPFYDRTTSRVQPAADIVFRFIIECSSLRDFGPKVNNNNRSIFTQGFLKDDILACVET